MSKKRKTLFGCLPPNNIANLKLWDTMYVDLIGPYSKYIRQHQTGGSVIKNNVSLACMTILDPIMGWFEIFKMPIYDLDEVMGSNYLCIDKSSSRLSQLFNNT